MLFANGLLTNDVLRWKAVGAAAWAAAVTLAASTLWSLTLAPASLLSPLSLLASLFSVSRWFASLALLIALAPAFMAQAAVLSTREPRPAHAHRLLHWPRAAAASMLLSKLAARAGSVGGAVRTAAFLGLHTLSAVLFLSLYSATTSSPTQGAGWVLQYAIWLAAAYLLHHLYWSRDVLLFPSVQRHRYFRIKQRLPAALGQAAKLATAAFVGAAATAASRTRAAGGGLSVAASAWPLGFSSSVAALLGGSLCTFCWLAAAAVLEVVFGERLQPGHYSDRDVLGAMAACLAGKRGDLMQGLALQDASLLASDVGKAALRRGDIFADETGDKWKPIAAACISELDSLAGAVAAALPQQKSAAPADGAGRAGVGAASQSRKWNVLPSALSGKGGLGSSKQQLEALLAVRCGYPRAVLAAHALAGFASASLKEDRFGVLQLTQPGLGEVLLCLLGTLGATQQLMRSTASLAPRQLSLGPWRGNGDPASSFSSAQSVDGAALALQDTLSLALHRIADTFGGEGLGKVLADCKGKPAFGSSSEAAALLQQLTKE